MNEFLFFSDTGIPTNVLISSFVLTGVIIGVGLVTKIVKRKNYFILSVILIEYLFLVASSTIVFRGIQYSSFERIQLQPFWTYYAVLKHTPGVSIWEIILNIVLFIPLGFLVKALSPRSDLRTILLIGMTCSIFIEATQYFLEKGIAQTDDVLHNTLGCLLGYGIYSLGRDFYVKSLKGLWQFCSYLFVPQRRPKEY